MTENEEKMAKSDQKTAKFPCPKLKTPVLSRFTKMALLSGATQISKVSKCEFGLFLSNLTNFTDV